MEIKRGDSVTFEGREYVVMSIQTTEDHVGRSISFVGRDPFFAQSVLDTEAARMEQQRNIQAMKTMIPKLDKQFSEE